MSHNDLRLTHPGEVEQEYSLTITATSSSTTVATAALTFDRAFASAPSVTFAGITGSTYGRKAVVGADTITTTGLTGYINPNGTAIEGSHTVKIIVCGKLAGA